MHVMVYRDPKNGDEIITAQGRKNNGNTTEIIPVQCAFARIKIAELDHYKSIGYVVDPLDLIERKNPLTVESLRALAKSKGIKLKGKNADEMRAEITRALEVANNGDN